MLPSSGSEHDLKLKDGLKGQGNTPLWWCSLEPKAWIIILTLRLFLFP